MAKPTSGADVTPKEIEETVNTYGPLVYRVAYAHSNIKADADDVFQEVFLLYAKKRPAFQSEAHRRNWLINVTLKYCKKTARASLRQRTVPLDEALCGAADPPGEDALTVYAAVKSLPVKYRVPVYLFYYEGLSVQQIAETLGEKPSTVKSRLFRAREKLREQLKGAYFDEE